MQRLQGKYQLLLIICLFLMPYITLSQNQQGDIRKLLAEQERPDDSYVPVSRDDMQKSPGYTYEGSTFFTTQVNVTDDGENIVGDAANEPSIAIDPNNPNRIMIGWRQFGTIFSNFRQAGYAYSLDGGTSWTFPEPIDAPQFRSDPVLAVDNEGVFYYNSLTLEGSQTYVCDIFKTTPTGVEWDEGVDAAGGDKQWMTIDRTTGPGQGNVYAFWNQSFSSCYPGSFVRSTDGGEVFEDCLAVDGNPYWGTMAVGPDGELYMVGRSSFGSTVVIKSENSQYADSAVSWVFEKEIDLGGRIDYGYEVNPAGLLGQAWIDVDRSNGPGRGNVYVLASVNRSFSGVQVDVMFTRSTDGGLNWDAPVKINTDLAYDDFQWFGTMSVAPNGRIDAVWLDTRDAFQLSVESALYYSYSLDQGVSWSENEKLSDLFDPRLGWPQQEKMGDYFDMVSDNTGAHLAWANTLNGEQDVYYAHIIPDLVGTREMLHEKAIVSLSAYPNPCTNQTTLAYQMTRPAPVRIQLFDVYGKVVQNVVQQEQPAGSHSHVISTEGLAGGVYYCRLQAGFESKTTRLMVVR